MDYSALNRSLFPILRSCCIVLLGILVILGWIFLLFAGFLYVLPYVPSLGPISAEVQLSLSGIFVTIYNYPFAVLLIIVIAGYLLHRLGWDTWF